LSSLKFLYPIISTKPPTVIDYTVKSAHCGGFTVKSTHRGGFTAKSTHCGGFTAKSTHCGGFTAKSTHCEGFTAKSTHCGGFTSKSTQCGGFATKSTHCGGFTAKSTQCGGWRIKSTQCGGWRIKSTQCGGWRIKSTHCGGFDVKSTHYTLRIADFAFDHDDKQTHDGSVVSTLPSLISNEARVERRPKNRNSSNQISFLLTDHPKMNVEESRGESSITVETGSDDVMTRWRFNGQLLYKSVVSGNATASRETPMSTLTFLMHRQPNLRPG
jgi:hypothetical protein